MQKRWLSSQLFFLPGLVKFQSEIRRMIPQNGWTVLDLLNLPNDVMSAEDKLHVVFRNSLVSDEIMHWFGLRCAAAAYKEWGEKNDNFIKLVQAKVRWLHNEITLQEFTEIRGDFWNYFSDSSYIWAATNPKAKLAALDGGFLSCLSFGIAVEVNNSWEKYEVPGNSRLSTTMNLWMIQKCVSTLAKMVEQSECSVITNIPM